MSGVALILGGASGIGAATARALALEGYTVAVADLSLASAQAVVDSLAGDGHAAYVNDVADEQGIVDCFQAVERELGPIRVLVVAAGVGGLVDGAVPTVRATPIESWDSVLDINARGTFLAIREMLRRRELSPVEHSRVVTIASIAAQTVSRKGCLSYAASKGAVLALTKVAACEAAEFGITVNAIAPGAIDTPLLRQAMPTEEALGVFTHGIAGRVGRPDEIAAAIVFLASPGAAYINGACIDVNGGTVMR